MTQHQKELWQKIQDFQLDDPDASFTFSARLARENGWTSEYTERVIDEYRKFIFLCCVSLTPITPSDAVDQAWHLHLTYTISYWQHLCKYTLNKEIHHNPTKGGKAERKKFNSNYTGLQEIYFSTFGFSPPQDIWLNNKMRFSKIHFQRVCLDDYWVVKKPRKIYRNTAITVAIIFAIALSIKASGAAFVLLICAFAVIAFIIQSKNNDKDNDSNSGCTPNSCSSCSHDSGCGSGCSGCGGCGGCS